MYTPNVPMCVTCIRAREIRYFVTLGGEHMKESTIEARLVREVKKRGGLCYKFISPNNPGVPDRIVITPAGAIYFVELKTARGNLRPEQKVQLRRLRSHNVRTAVLYGQEDAIAFARMIENQRGGSDTWK